MEKVRLNWIKEGKREGFFLILFCDLGNWLKVIVYFLF